jgi:hypothetical protein
LKVVTTETLSNTASTAYFGRALDARQHLLLAQRDAQLGVGGQDLGVDLVEGLGPLLLHVRGVVVQLVIGRRLIDDLGPGGLRQLEEAGVGLQPPVQHPLGLALLGGDEADRGFGQPLGPELLFDVGDEAMLIGGERLDGFDGFCDGDH